MKINNYIHLRNALCETVEKLMCGKMDAKTGTSVASVAGKVIQLESVKLGYYKLSQESGKDTPTLNANMTNFFDNKAKLSK